MHATVQLSRLMIPARPRAIKRRNPLLYYCSCSISGRAGDWFLFLWLSASLPGEESYLPTCFLCTLLSKRSSNVGNLNLRRWRTRLLHSPHLFLPYEMGVEHFCCCISVSNTTPAAAKRPARHLRQTLWSGAGRGFLNWLHLVQMKEGERQVSQTEIRNVRGHLRGSWLQFGFHFQLSLRK